MELETIVDVAFPAQGGPLPLDHGYPLFAAISRLIPRAHGEMRWGIHPVRGTRAADELRLDESSFVKLRMPAAQIAAVLPLAGAGLEFGPERVVKLGVPRIFALVPSGVLRARIVTIRGFFEDEEPFEAALRRQLATLELGQDPERVVVTVGRRRIVRVKETAIVGFAVMLEGLDADASLAVQIAGLGGRRHMGCGVFVPPGRQG